MPAATQDQKPVLQGKKRWLDDAEQQHTTLFQSEHYMHSDDGVPNNSPTHIHRRFVPLPNPKRIRRSPTQDDDLEKLRVKSASALNPCRSPSKELSDVNCKPIPPRHHTSTPAQLLNRCHICHRKPTKKADLDSFADCQGCGQRTCFVCIRQCLDWRPEHQKRWNGYGSASFHMKDADDVVVSGDGEDNHVLRQHQTNETIGDKDAGTVGWAKGGHRKMICSRCCVERGPDGDVVCLGCLPFVEG